MLRLSPLDFEDCGDLTDKALIDGDSCLELIADSKDLREVID
jgi:hypothetical protein